MPIPPSIPTGLSAALTWSWGGDGTWPLPQRVVPLTLPPAPNPPPAPFGRVSAAVMSWWEPVEFIPQRRARLSPPQAGPAVNNPPLIDHRMPITTSGGWEPFQGWALPQRAPPRTPPVSGPVPSAPPFPGPLRGVRQAILESWYPLPERAIVVRNIVPPIPGVPKPTLPAQSLATNLFALFNNIVEGTNQTWCFFDLYTITLFEGTVIRLTTADFDIAAFGARFLSTSVRIDEQSSKVQAHWKIGLDVDTWTVVFMPRPFDPITGASFPDMVGSVPWIQAAHGGYFDNADFQVDRAYFTTMPTWPMPPGGAAPIGTKTIFAGKVAQIDCTDLVTVFTVNDYRDMLSLSMPRHFFQGTCRHTLFDVGCNASGNMLRSSFAQQWSVEAGSTQGNIIASGIPLPGGSNTYTLGTVIMTSGLNAGFQRTVSNWDGTNLLLFSPFPFTLQVGDTFSVAAGCDLQRSTCLAFGNLLNFGGFPFIPAPEVIA